MEFYRVCRKIENQENLTLEEIKVFKEGSLIKVRRTPNVLITNIILKFLFFYNKEGKFKGSL